MSANGTNGHSPAPGKFPLGQIVATPGALAALEAAGDQASVYLRRHHAGDWGELGHYDSTELSEKEWAGGPFATEDGAKLNKWGVHKDGRILSEYHLSDGATRLWIIIEADRLATTLLLPSEY